MPDVGEEGPTGAGVKVRVVAARGCEWRRPAPLLAQREAATMIA
jgi:hypothetical protein